MYKRLSSTSLQFKLQASLALLSVTAISIFLIMAVRNNQAVKSAKENQVKAVTESLMDKIDRNLFERYGDVQAFALSETARGGVSERIVSFMSDMIAAYSPIYDLMIVTNKTGKVIAVSGVDKNGKKVESGYLVGKDYSNTTWFKAAMSGSVKPGTSFVEDLYVDSDVAKILGNSGKVMSFTAPITDKRTGKILGVWSNRMSWSDVVEAITKEESQKILNDQITSVQSYIIDNKGMYMIHPGGGEFELKKIKEDFRAVECGKKAETSLIYKKSNANNYLNSILELTAPSRGYSTYPERGWSAVIQVPAGDSKAALNRFLLVFSLVLLLIVNLLVGRFISSLSTHFEKTISELTKQSMTLKKIADQISSSSKDLAAVSTEQAAAIDETVSSMEEIGSMISQTSQHAENGKKMSKDGKSASEMGSNIVLKMTHSIEAIQSGNEKLDTLVQLIGEIGIKTRVINEIVSETRLLSFNASIEAARAGVHGRGFAVVAEEISKLATLSGKAAEEINGLLETSAKEVNQVVSNIRDKVNVGKNVSSECGNTLKAVIEVLSSISEIVGFIATAASEQEIGVKQTNTAMNEMEKVTHTNSAAAETLASYAGELSGGAKILDDAIHGLKNLVLGAGSARN